jgi:hypothetical protein
MQFRDLNAGYEGIEFTIIDRPITAVVLRAL